MRKLLLFSLVAMVGVGGLALYTVKVMGDFQQRDEALRSELAERTEDLRALDELFPYRGEGRLDPARFPLYVEVRQAVSAALRARIGEPARSFFRDREKHNDLLRLLRIELQARKMGPTEYRANAARWRTILARPEFAALQKTWRAVVTTDTDQDGVPLPPPANDATQPELELIRSHAPALEESMYADLLDR